MVLSIFSCAYWPLYIFLEEMAIQILCSLLKWIICLFIVDL